MVKIAALGFVDYWSDDWNKFDLLVTLINVPDTFDLIDVDIGASVVRIFRLARMFKVFNSANACSSLFTENRSRSMIINRCPNDVSSVGKLIIPTVSSP